MENHSYIRKIVDGIGLNMLEWVNLELPFLHSFGSNELFDAALTLDDIRPGLSTSVPTHKQLYNRTPMTSPRFEGKKSERPRRPRAMMYHLDLSMDGTCI